MQKEEITPKQAKDTWRSEGARRNPDEARGQWGKKIKELKWALAMRHVEPTLTHVPQG